MGGGRGGVQKGTAHSKRAAAAAAGAFSQCQMQAFFFAFSKCQMQAFVFGGDLFVRSLFLCVCVCVCVYIYIYLLVPGGMH